MNYKKVSFWITLALVIGVMAIIFNFSSQNGETSANTSGNIVNFVIKTFFPNFDSKTELEQIQLYETVSFVVRKLAHFSEFAFLGFMLIVHTTVGEYMFRTPLSILIGVVYAMTDEFHQSFVGGRAMQITDVLIDSCGVITGVLFAIFVFFIISKIKNRKMSRVDLP